MVLAPAIDLPMRHAEDVPDAPESHGWNNCGAEGVIQYDGTLSSLLAQRRLSDRRRREPHYRCW